MGENDPPNIKQEAPSNPNLLPLPNDQIVTPSPGQLTRAQQLQAAIRQQQAQAAAKAAILAAQGKNPALNRLSGLHGDDEQPVAFTSFNDGEETDSEISNIDDEFDNDGGISQLKNELVLEKETDSDVSTQ